MTRRHTTAPSLSDIMMLLNDVLAPVLRLLLQVANQPLYASFVKEVLGSAEGCELYMLPPSLFGLLTNEIVSFAEVQAVGLLLRKSVLGVVAGGRVVLAPGREWNWKVGEQDKVAVLAASW
jgi:hypothetical protein